MFALVLFAMAFFVSPARADESSQSQCFQMLKNNMAEAGMFAAPLQEMDKMTYQDLSSKFSRNYKSLSSFGIEINQNDFEMRVYSFGKQTGYVHPPLVPFPVSTKSDSWDEPAKQYIIAEEYINEPSGNKHFVDCVFISIASADLMKVTRENYLYDGATISLAKTATDGSYKTWYSENPSFDYASKPLATWKRLFVYPKSTQNEYFNKYDVADARPANKVENLDVLKFFSQNLIRLQNNDEKGNAVTKFFMLNDKGEPSEAVMPKALLPVERTGINEVFPLNEYYQAIEARFPIFAKLLSIRGTLKYETFKKLITEKQNPEAMKIVNALLDFRQLAGYSADKKANEKNGVIVTDPVLDKLLADVANADTAIQKISGKDVPVNNAKEQENTETKITPYLIVGLVTLLSVSLLILVVVLRKYKKLDN